MPAQITLEQEAETFASQEAIAATLQQYIDGARIGDGGIMRLAFAETARISGTYSGKTVEWTVSEFCEIIQNGGPAVDLQTRIVGIEHAGNAAMARLEARNWRGARYTGLLCLEPTGRGLAHQEQGVLRPLTSIGLALSRRLLDRGVTFPLAVLLAYPRRPISNRGSAAARGGLAQGGPKSRASANTGVRDFEHQETRNCHNSII